MPLTPKIQIVTPSPVKFREDEAATTRETKHTDKHRKGYSDIIGEFNPISQKQLVRTNRITNVYMIKLSLRRQLQFRKDTDIA